MLFMRDILFQSLFLSLSVLFFSTLVFIKFWILFGELVFVFVFDVRFTQMKICIYQYSIVFLWKFFIDSSLRLSIVDEANVVVVVVYSPDG